MTSPSLLRVARAEEPHAPLASEFVIETERLDLRYGKKVALNQLTVRIAVGRIHAIGWGNGGKLLWMFGGGLLIGFGTRLAGGCTSGHGIFGMSNLELPSIISTGCFMAAGIVTTNLIYRVIL